MMKTKFTALSIVVFVVLSLVLTACANAASAGNTNLSVDLKDFTFKPDTFKVPAGKEITVSVTNKGANVHEFVIMKVGTLTVQ